ncbi:MAG: hypothetical protein IJP56_00755 [Synergistaceae bacterium]|nr:hypothetical protein [Synergistaceae bacterium]
MTDEERIELRGEARRGRNWRAAAEVLEDFCAAYREQTINKLEDNASEGVNGLICLLKAIKTFRLMALTYIQHGELAEKELREEENEDSEE